MPPLLARFLQQLLAFALSPVFTWLAARGIFTLDESTEYVTELGLTLVGLLWMLWGQYKDRLSFLAAWIGAPKAKGAEIEALMETPQVKALAFTDHQPTPR